MMEEYEKRNSRLGYETWPALEPHLCEVRVGVSLLDESRDGWGDSRWLVGSQQRTVRHSDAMIGDRERRKLRLELLRRL
jgi:hypothetical protein